MTKTDHELPIATRSASEVAFVLRGAKWRRGPEVLRDVSRAHDGDDDLPAEPPRRDGR